MGTVREDAREEGEVKGHESDKKSAQHVEKVHQSHSLPLKQQDSKPLESKKNEITENTLEVENGLDLVSEDLEEDNQVLDEERMEIEGEQTMENQKEE